MQEKLVTLKVAKLAKEQGFNWNVSSFLQEEGNVIVNEFYACKHDSLFYSNKPKFDLVHNANSNLGWVSLPTQSLLQKWLRDVHKIDLIVSPFINRTGYGVEGYIKNKFAPIEVKEKTYEDALEEGLLEAFKIIKNK